MPLHKMRIRLSMVLHRSSFPGYQKSINEITKFSWPVEINERGFKVFIFSNSIEKLIRIYKNPQCLSLEIKIFSSEAPLLKSCHVFTYEQICFNSFNAFVSTTMTITINFAIIAFDFDLYLQKLTRKSTFCYCRPS